MLAIGYTVKRDIETTFAARVMRDHGIWSMLQTLGWSSTRKYQDAQSPFYARGQTGQQLLLGAYQALAQIEAP